MNKSKKSLIAIAMLLGVSGGVFAFGKHNLWGISPEDKADFVTGQVTKKLDLNESQQQNLEMLAGHVLSLMKEMRADKEIHKVQIVKMLAEPILDQARALQMIHAKTRQINEKAPAVIASLAVFLDSLEANQKSQLQSFVSKGIHQRHKHWEDDLD